MLRTRKLVLRKETLSDLSPDMLEKVVGGSLAALCAGETWDCTRQVDCINDISFEICPTLNIEECVRTELLCAIQTR